jgi:hypothetical protein
MMQVDFALERNYSSATAASRPRKRCTTIVVLLVWLAVFALAAMLPIVVHAEPAADRTDVDHSKFEIITNALGLERFTEYSAHRDALGIEWAHHLGMEAAYYGLGDSRFAEPRAAVGDNIGGRANVKLAVDLIAPLNERARLYSRVGVYWWEVDVNYNRVNNDLNNSLGGTSRMIGVGAVYGADPLRFGVEIERLESDALSASGDEHRVWFNLFSRY